MIRTLIATFVLTFSSFAHAQATDWARVDDRMNTAFKVGTTTMWVGFAGGIVGSVTAQPVVSLVSNVATTGGTVTRTSSSLRQRRSIQERGVEVSGLWGYTSWGLMGTGLVLGTAGGIYAAGLEYDENGAPPAEAIGPLLGYTFGALAANIGGLIASSKQMQVNRRKRVQIGSSKLDNDQPKFTMQWTPVVDTEGGMGMGLKGTF